MKLIHTIPLIVATAFFALTGCNKAPDEKTAIANFKTEIESTTKWMEEKQKATATDPVAGIAMMGEMVNKFKGIKTDGLPADIKAAWGEMTAIFGELGDVFKGMPKLDVTKPQEMEKTMGDLMPKMMAVMAKGDPVAKKLEEIGKKYGLDMKNLAPGK